MVEMLPVVPLNVTALDVVALLVDAFDVRKLEDEPNNVVMYAEVMFAIAETRFAMLKLVEVPFVIVASATFIAGKESFVTDKFVTVAEVRVALPPEIFTVVMFAVAIFEVVELVVEASKVVNCAVPVALMFVKFPV